MSELTQAFETTKKGNKFHSESKLPKLEVEALADSLLQRLDCSCGFDYRPIETCRLYYGGPLYKKTMYGNRPKYQGVPEAEWPEAVKLFVAQMTPVGSFVGQVVEEPPAEEPELTLAEVFAENNAGRDDEQLYRKVMHGKKTSYVAVTFDEIEAAKTEEGDGETLYVKRNGKYVVEASDLDPAPAKSSIGRHMQAV